MHENASLTRGLRTVKHLLTMHAVSVLNMDGVSKVKSVEKVKWRMAPLLSRPELLQTDKVELQCDPFVRVYTKDLTDLIAKALKNMKIAQQKKGKKCLLIRQSSIAVLNMWGGEYKCTCVLALLSAVLCTIV